METSTLAAAPTITAESLKARIAAVSRDPAGRLILPPDVKLDLGRYARQRQAEGIFQKAIGQELGLSTSAVHTAVHNAYRASLRPPEAHGVRPVVILSEESSTPKTPVIEKAVRTEPEKPTQREAVAADLKRRIAAVPLGPGGLRTRLPADVKEDLASYVKRRRGRGLSDPVIARELGVCRSLVRRARFFATATEDEISARDDVAPLPAASSACAGVIVLPNGMRIEGLSVEEIARVSKELMCSAR
jgi:hypothetical protein